MTAFASWAIAREKYHARPTPDKPVAEFESRVAPFVLPFEFPGTQYAPVAWPEIPGWADDDQFAAYKTFLVSCKSILATRKPLASADSKAIGDSLRAPCEATKTAAVTDAATARAFFEAQFAPLRISRLDQPEGFVTGYYEPIIDGSRTPSDIYNVPVYRRPSNLFVRGTSQATLSLPNKGDVFRKIGRRRLVPYHDRAAIEDGAIAGRGLEIVWLKNQTDLLFTQIQGSARVKLDDGGTARINYEAHNGFPYTPVGRILIDRNIIPREQMSMQRIRQWMADNPEGGNELRRQNKSYVFFREVQLSDADEAVGAQGVPLTPNRSIAVDRFLHVYGTPFFIEGELPIESTRRKRRFAGDDRAGHRLGHRRSGARGHLFRRGRGGGQGCGTPQEFGTFRDAGAEGARSDGWQQDDRAAAGSAVGRDREAVPAAPVAAPAKPVEPTAPVVAAPPVAAAKIEPPNAVPPKAVPLPEARPKIEAVRMKRPRARRHDRHRRPPPAKQSGWFW